MLHCIYPLKSSNRIRPRLLQTWKTHIDISKPCLVFIYLETCLCRFHLLQNSKSFLYWFLSISNYCIYTIQYSLLDVCWMNANSYVYVMIPCTNSNFSKQNYYSECCKSLLGSKNCCTSARFASRKNLA